MARGKYAKKGKGKGGLIVLLIITMIVTIGCVVGIWLVMDEDLPVPETQPTYTTIPETSGETTETTTVPATTEATIQPTEETTVPTEETTVPVEETTAPTVLPTIGEDATVGQQIAQTALAQIGKGYQSGGNGPDAFDTSGFISFCLKENQLITGRKKLKQLAQEGVEVPQEELQPGDVLFFWTSNEGQVEYAGIYVGGGEFVAARKEGIPVSLMKLQHFSNTYLFARRFG